MIMSILRGELRVGWREICGVAQCICNMISARCQPPTPQLNACELNHYDAFLRRESGSIYVICGGLVVLYDYAFSHDTATLRGMIGVCKKIVLIAYQTKSFPATTGCFRK